MLSLPVLSSSDLRNGLGTIVGTATNALVAGFMQQNYGETISFAQWLAFGIPTVLVLMPVAWLVLVKISFPFQLGSQTIARDRLIEARAALGPMSNAERRVTTVFVITAAAWIFGPLLRELPGLADNENCANQRRVDVRLADGPAEPPSKSCAPPDEFAALSCG